MSRLSLLLLSLSVSVLLSSLALPAQSSATSRGEPAVREIDVEAFKALLTRDPSKAQPLLVNFWATWCDPCRDEFPDLVKIDADYRPKGLDVIAVSLDDVKDINTAVPKFLREMKARMPVYLLNVIDPEPAIKFVDPMWDGAMPATFLYNTAGKIVYKHFGRIKAEELRSEIQRVMSDKW
jgi:thiol-disulfide isomerase/thioredoxin